jgi:hypothetical protein
MYPVSPESSLKFNAVVLPVARNRARLDNRSHFV